jgi:hypothetical protein
MQTAYESSFESERRTLDRRTLRRAIEFLDDVNEEIEALVREQWLPDDSAAVPTAVGARA